MTLAGEIHARLAADPTLAALLAEYQAAPAVVVSDAGTLPEDLDTPCVLIDGPSSDESLDTKVEDQRDQLVSIFAYDDAGASPTRITTIAERIRALLHRQPDGLADGAYIALCSGPRLAPTDNAFRGREVVLRLISRTDPTNPPEEPS